MIKFREFLAFVHGDDGFVGGNIGETIGRIIVIGLGILVLALLVFPVRMVLPSSQIASQAVSTIQVDPVAQAVQLAVQSGQLAQRACILSKHVWEISSEGAFRKIPGE